MGDPGPLADLLRGQETLPRAIRDFVASVVDGTERKPRGNKLARSLPPNIVVMMRTIHEISKSHGVPYKTILRELAALYKRSEASVRDVLEKRGAYAEK